MTDDQVRVALQRQVADLERKVETMELKRKVRELQLRLADYRVIPPGGHWVSSGG